MELYKILSITENPVVFTVNGTEQEIEITAARVFIETNLGHFKAKRGCKLILFEWLQGDKQQQELYDWDANYLGCVYDISASFRDGVEPCTEIKQIQKI